MYVYIYMYMYIYIYIYTYIYIYIYIYDIGGTRVLFAVEPETQSGKLRAAIDNFASQDLFLSTCYCLYCFMCCLLFCMFMFYFLIYFYVCFRIVFAKVLRRIVEAFIILSKIVSKYCGNLRRRRTYTKAARNSIKILARKFPRPRTCAPRRATRCSRSPPPRASRPCRVPI